MARRLVVLAAAANIWLWIGIAQADQILLLPEGGANWLFHADAGSFGLLSLNQPSAPVDPVPAPAQDSNQAASAPVNPPPVVDVSSSNPFLFVPANNDAIDHSPVLVPGPADLAEIFLPDPTQLDVPPPPPPAPDFSFWGDSPFLFGVVPPVVVPPDPVVGPPVLDIPAFNNNVSEPVVGIFIPPPVVGPVEQVVPFADAPLATPEPGTMGLLIAGAAFAMLRSLRLKRS